ncbi:SCP2 sterol-binding domain-containing protein [Streptomyces sp. NBC_00377]|uniref:SCP2 sterol-binding domain-containing protein n=1 Tax=unclassified Streptomyces TaxID=2593676 RepID=UPI002E0E6A5E|nr:MULTISPECIES: SCP2 sterol-binding domain-containing protein [unclassified Streptomyces]WSN46018.1 SCP2 sterol-binding domain-containing protein [Streptomyces sp. NBC_01334]
MSAAQSVDAAELHEALVDYAKKANQSPRVAKTLAAWSCRIHIEATDQPDALFTFVIDKGHTSPAVRGAEGVPDLVVRGNSMDLAEIFWGDANPVSNYMQGAIRTQGRADDVMRLDAMAMFIFLGQ